MTETTVPLRCVLERADLGLSALVPPEDPEVPVRWVHPSEVRDPVPYLLGSELLLTAGVSFPRDTDEIDRYVAALVGAGVSALGFGLTPVYDAVPEPLIASCRQRRLPLLSIPDSTPFLAVSRAVGEAVSEARNGQLRRLSEAELALTRAAARPDPVREVLAALARSLDCWACVVGPGGRVVDATSGAPTPEVDVLELAERLREGSGPRSASAEMATPRGGELVVLHPVESAASRPSVLVAGRGRAFGGGDRAVLAVAVALLAVLDRERSGRSGCGEQLLTRLLLDPSSETADSALASALAVPRGHRYRVLHAVAPGGAADAGPPPDAALVERGHDLVRAIASEQAQVELGLRRRGWLVGISRAVTADRLAEADRQAEAALRRAKATGRAIGDEDEDERALSAVVDEELAGDFAERAFAPLAEISSPSPVALLRTLRSWLAHHGNWNEASEDLGVHRNSVRHRIRRIEALLGTDLADPQRRMELWFAQQWLPRSWPRHR